MHQQFLEFGNLLNYCLITLGCDFKHLLAVGRREVNDQFLKNCWSKYYASMFASCQACVYGIVLIRDGDVECVIGSAFAIASDLALSAWHNFTEHGYQPSDGIILCKEICGGGILRSSPLAVVADYDEADDWVTLKLKCAAFSIFSTLCPETELPPERKQGGGSVGIEAIEFPANLWLSSRHVTVSTLSCKIWNYSAPFVAHSALVPLRFADEFPQEDECALNICNRYDPGGISSHGGPYVAENGKVVAFHVRSGGHAGVDQFHEGRVLARLGSFTAKYAHLFVT